MKKSILSFLTGIMLTAQLSSEIFHLKISSEVESAQSENKAEQSDKDFEDFFGVDEAPPSADGTPRPKKEKLSRLKILMMQMGVSLALAIEQMYGWLCAVWAYAASLVKHERKA